MVNKRLADGLITGIIAAWLGLAGAGILLTRAAPGTFTEMLAYSLAVPILAAAFRFGRPAGLGVALLASLLSGSLAVGQPEVLESPIVQRVLFQVIFFNAVALMIGGMAERRQEIQKQLETIQDAALVGILLIEAETHRIVEINRYAAGMVGLPREQIIGRVCYPFLCPHCQEECPITDLKQPLDNSERVLLRADGSAVPIHKTVTPVTIAGQDYLLETFLDLSERHKAALVQRDYVSLLETMRRVDRIILGAGELETMLDNILDEMLRTFGCDRAWLLFPCDPAAPAWAVPLEKTTQHWPGVSSRGVEIPMDEGARVILREALAAQGPVVHDLERVIQTRGEDEAGRFGVQSQIFMALRPKIGQPWMLGMQQCTHERRWSEAESSLFREIGGRISDGLSSLLLWQNLQASETRFRALIENAVDGIAILDQEAVFRYLSPSVERILGYPADELLGRSAFDDVHPKDLARQRADFAEALAHPGRLMRIEFRRRSRSGEWVCLEAAAQNLLHDPNVGGIVLNFRDSTARMHAELELRDSEARFRVLAEQSPTPVLVYVDDKVYYCNPAAMQSLGVGAAEELCGKPFLAFVHPDSLELVRDRMRWLAAGEELGLAEEKVVTLDGREIQVLVNTTKIIYDGHPAVIVQMLDITGHKQAQQKIAELAQFNENIVASAPVGIVTVDREGRATSANEAFLRITGSPGLAETLELGMYTPTVQRTSLAAAFQKTISDGTSFELKNLPYTSNFGVEVIANVKGVPQKADDGRITGVIIVVEDVTGTARAEAKIHQQLQRLEALHRIDQAITASTELGLVLDTILEHTIGQLEVDAAAILLHKAATSELEYASGRGFRTEALQHTHLRLGEGYAGRAALERRILRLGNLKEGKTDFLNSPHFKAEEFETYIGAPLIAKGELKGVLEIFHRAPLDPSPEWLSFLETLATQAAISIESASLFDGLQRAHRELSEAYDATLEGWARALELRDQETLGHTRRVVALTLSLATALGVPQDDMEQIRRGALVHDVGKMAVPDSILLKPGPLTPQEKTIMRQHTEYACSMLAPIAFLRPALEIPSCHHEKWDGTGYPRGLKGEEIPLSARIFAVVDVWDALVSERPYRKAWPRQQVVAYIRDQSGGHFDPRVVEAFWGVLEAEGML